MPLDDRAQKNAPEHEQGAIAIAYPLSRRSLCRSWHLTHLTTPVWSSLQAAGLHRADSLHLSG